MASPLTNQVVNDLKQNFYWSYISQFAENKSVAELEITVAAFLEYIAIDLFSEVAYGPNDYVTLYYGMNEKSSLPGNYYFTYMLANTEVSPGGAMINTGIIGHPAKFLLLEEANACEAVYPIVYDTRKGIYELSSIFSPYINQTMVINSFSNHPTMCSYPKEDFKNFILDNMTSEEMDLSTLTLVFQMGATLVEGVNSNYKVQTPLIITKDNLGLRLDPINYIDAPFKCKAMDVGKLCPPNCNDDTGEDYRRRK